MFTGLIEEIGTITRIAERAQGVEIAIECSLVRSDAALGDSIAVDGCCLTVETLTPGGFTMFASPETLAKTSLGDRRAGDGVNLERAMRVGDRLGGHMVSGHVDATGKFLSATNAGDSHEVRIRVPKEIARQSIAKGSITIDGISLTIVDLTETEMSFWIIPETWTRTTLGGKQPGQRVNLESDMIGKYVAKHLEGQKAEI